MEYFKDQNRLKVNRSLNKEDNKEEKEKDKEKSVAVSVFEDVKVSTLQKKKF